LRRERAHARGGVGGRGGGARERKAEEEPVQIDKDGDGARRCAGGGCALLEPLPVGGYHRLDFDWRRAATACTEHQVDAILLVPHDTFAELEVLDPMLWQGLPYPPPQLDGWSRTASTPKTKQSWTLMSILAWPLTFVLGAEHGASFTPLNRSVYPNVKSLTSNAGSHRMRSITSLHGRKTGLGLAPSCPATGFARCFLTMRTEPAQPQYRPW